MSSWFGGSRRRTPQQPASSNHNTFHQEGTIECRACGTEQPYTNHRCMECGEDPWAEPQAGWGGVPQPSAPPPAYGAASEQGLGAAGRELLVDSMTTPPSQAAIDAITGMGIEESWARLALSRCNNDAERAITFCFENDMPTLVANAPRGGGGGG
eukprot:CAMPEP_0119541286 /NCGR_PEP_ID=MMETSP1344-20130328/52871_1 /TAXON_ID=236787 /ORGANISM="Florenciella parvula, Strain CCMP2471" /LENGTH=154 /DNA_ID=CAMNT_0007585239 /DNA_START=97 /DNA_END=558 /DNA_ORIENTATION=-